jgi:hypothetical protein
MVALNPTWIALFYVALVGALALALLLTARYAAVVKLEQSLRRAED